MYICTYILLGWVHKKKGGWVADVGPLIDGWEMKSKATHRGIRDIKVLSKGKIYSCNTYICCINDVTMFRMILGTSDSVLLSTDLRQYSNINDNDV